eukprot:CAMPEP_0119052738 /NCGR_PEP_ID=MMETSP1177-20130426/73929_1 /TAXON_ID=2985 /ORGANISM="Ochromonas sp, Strain CCMP1899" /LENGTH=512 /DNA_ID=CAMNT_0007032401 /DNA_START=868 /DNA_END=2406 /DNA_ORIENTATION=+
MTSERAQRKFPQLNNSEILYCPVFYEGQHDDARTNLAIAQSAGIAGASIANYCDVTTLLRENGAKSGKVVGATVKDVLTGKTFNVKAKTILFCGGPFTDELRKLEDDKAENVVNGAGGIHIVLPAYYAPSNFGMVDMSTSDGRFMFFLPWNGHVLVGTTDHKEKASMRPEPDETEIRWLLTEASKYLNPQLKLRRTDVLSAWSGIRPLAADPHAKVDPNAAVSRDHVISHNPDSDIVFIAGGKWTTYREMAQDAVDKLIEVGNLQGAKPCTTLTTGLTGRKGYSNNLPIQLVQEYNIGIDTANRLAKAYGGRAYDVLDISKNELGYHNQEGKLVTGHAYLEAEIIYACRHEWASQADDFVARRTRLAFVNKDLTISLIPKIVSLMGKELKWDASRQKQEITRCLDYMRHFGGQRAARLPNTARISTIDDVTEAFKKIDNKATGSLDVDGIELVAELLNHPCTSAELQTCFESKSKDMKKDRITLQELFEWWNSSSANPYLAKMDTAAAIAIY